MKSKNVVFDLGLIYMVSGTQDNPPFRGNVIERLGIEAAAAVLERSWKGRAKRGSKFKTSLFLGG